MSKNEERDPYDQVIDNAGALHDAAIESLPPEIRGVADSALDRILRVTRERPFIALLLAGALGFLFASVSSR